MERMRSEAVGFMNEQKGLVFNGFHDNCTSESDVVVSALLWPKVN